MSALSAIRWANAGRMLLGNQVDRPNTYHTRQELGDQVDRPNMFRSHGCSSHISIDTALAVEETYPATMDALPVSIPRACSGLRLGHGGGSCALRESRRAYRKKGQGKKKAASPAASDDRRGAPSA